MLHIDVGEALVLELHLSELKDQLQVTGAVLEADLFDLSHDERAHLDRVEAEPLGEVPFPIVREDPALEDVSAGEGELEPRIDDQVFFSRKSRHCNMAMG